MTARLSPAFNFAAMALAALISVLTAEIGSEIQAMMYLQRFGYMSESNGRSNLSASMISEGVLLNAVKEFQRFAGLNETGLLDSNTIQMMNTPRCGVKDRVGHGVAARRRRRFALQGSKWRVKELTYRISKYPTAIKNHADVDKEIARAFKVWSDVTPLKFTVKTSGRVHIDVRFERGEHGDGDPFDGPSQTLAHAFFPQYGGDVHFDDDENWTIGSYKGTNLFMVAAHEIGHSLGLSHSDIKRSLMAPFYMGYKADFQLDEDDVNGIQALYGKSSGSPTTAKPPNDLKPPSDTSDAPDLCQSPEIDAVTKTQDGKTYVFKGDYYWRILTNGIADGYPRVIKDDWDGLPGNLDAVLTWSDGKTFFFKGSKYWRFYNKKMDSGYPKEIDVGFKGIPNSVDAALLWSGNGKTYFFKGDKYWRFDSRQDPPVSDRYPKPVVSWEGIPNDLDAAFQWENGRTYFFKGRNYYRFNDNDFAVDKGSPAYPRSTSVWWFDCKAMSGKDGEIHSGLMEWDKPRVPVKIPGSESRNGDDPQQTVVDGNDDMDSTLRHQSTDNEVNALTDGSRRSMASREKSSALLAGILLLLYVRMFVRP